MLISHAIGVTDSAGIREIMDGIPMIQFDRVVDDIPGAKILEADFDGAYQATQHLIAQGYRRIGTLAGFLDSPSYALRLAGYRKALEDAGMEYDETLVFPGTIVRETGYATAALARERGCDALYSAGAYSALGAIQALQEQKVSIPGDFGIVGTADESFTALMTPSLSTLDLHPSRMGQAAARAFLEGRTDTQVIPMELIVRQSSKRSK